MPNLMAVETSSGILSAAVCANSRPIAEKKIKGSLCHGERLIPTLEGLLSSSRLPLRRLDAYLIGLGPGSFTGLRVGFSTLKGLLAVHKAACYGASSLDLIAFGLDLPLHSNLAVCVEGGLEKIYFRLYRRHRWQWKAAHPPLALSSSEVLEKIPGDVTMTGSAVPRYRKEFEKNSGSVKINFLPERAWYPKARSLVKMFETKSPFLRPLVKPRDFVPFYLMRSEAEERGITYAG